MLEHYDEIAPLLERKALELNARGPYKLTEEFLTGIVQEVNAAGRGALGKVATANDVSERTVRRWLAEARGTWPAVSVDKRPNGTYRVRWREFAGGPQLTRTFARKRDADALDRDMQHALQHGSYVDPAQGTVPLVQMMAEHIERQPGRYNTKRNAVPGRSVMLVATSVSGRSARSALPDMQAFVAVLDRSLSAHSVATVWRFVRQTTRAAHLDGVIGRDPCAGVKLPRHEGDELLVPTVGEVVALRDAASPDFAVAIVLGAGLGLRAAEAAGLTLDRINFLRREVRIDRQWHGALNRFEPVKAAASNRTIPAGDSVLEAMALHVERHGAGDHGVLLHAGGRPLARNRMSWRWSHTAANVRPELTFHALRHHYASSLISAGCSIVAVQRALGHSSASITLNTYGHLMPSDADRIRTAVDVAWAEDSVRTDGAHSAR